MYTRRGEEREIHTGGVEGNSRADKVLCLLVGDHVGGEPVLVDVREQEVQQLALEADDAASVQRQVDDQMLRFQVLRMRVLYEGQR